MASRNECLPRKIKRINKQEDSAPPEEKQTYAFYRPIIHSSILRLNNEKDKLNCSLWLTRLDSEESKLKIHLIKILFLSLNKNRPLYIFTSPPPKDLSELNLLEDNTMEMIENLQNTTYMMLGNEYLQTDPKHKRSAAVAPDMCSYSSIKTSKFIAQTFYAISDYPIYTWYNPYYIRTPNNYDHNQWELYLNKLDILVETKEKGQNGNKHKNKCEDIMGVDQIEKEAINSNSKFSWHPHSILYGVNRPKRTASFVEADQDIANQPSNQQQIDENAIGIVHKKTFPGYKMLNPRIYSKIIMPDPSNVFNMTGVKIIYNDLSKVLNDDRNNQSDNSCTQNATKKQLPCLTTTTQKTSESQTPLVDNNTTEKNIKVRNNSECSNQNETYQECQNSCFDSKDSLDSTHRIKPKMECESDISSKNDVCDNHYFDSNNNFESENISKSKMLCETNILTMKHKKIVPCLYNKGKNYTNSEQNNPDNKHASEVIYNNCKTKDPCESSVSGTSDYDLTISNGDFTLDQSCVQSCASETLSNTSQKHNKRRCKHDKHSLNESLIQNLSCKNEMTQVQHSRKTKKCSSQGCRHHHNKEYEKQRSRNSKINLPHSGQIQSEECINENTNLSFRRKNTNRYLKSKHNEFICENLQCEDQVLKSQVQYSGKTEKCPNKECKQHRNEKHEEQQFHNNEKNLSHSEHLQNVKCINDNISLKSKYKSELKPHGYKCTHQFKTFQGDRDENQNDSSPEHSEYKHSKTYDTSKENIDRLPSTETNCSNRNENESKFKHNETWDKSVSDYSLFTGRDCFCGDEPNTQTPKEKNKSKKLLSKVSSNMVILKNENSNSELKHCDSKCSHQSDTVRQNCDGNQNDLFSIHTECIHNKTSKENIDKYSSMEMKSCSNISENASKSKQSVTWDSNVSFTNRNCFCGDEAPKRKNLLKKRKASLNEITDENSSGSDGIGFNKLQSASSDYSDCLNSTKTECSTDVCQSDIDYNRVNNSMESVADDECSDIKSMST